MNTNTMKEILFHVNKSIELLLNTKMDYYEQIKDVYAVGEGIIELQNIKEKFHAVLKRMEEKNNDDQ
jgi:hypothetical protein